MDKARLHFAKIRSFVLNAVLLVAVFIVVAAFQSRNMLATDGQQAPALRGATLDGKIYDLADADGRPALIYFFAPWCKFCAASADNLSRLRRWRDEDDIEIIAVGLDWSTPQEIHEYAERHDLNVTVVIGDTNVARQWRVQAFPSYYVLDRNHRLVRRDIGYSTQFGLWWRAWLIN